MPNDVADRVYQFISYMAVFVVLGFACIIIPKTKILSVSTYHTLALFSTITFTGVYFGIQLLKKESHSIVFSIYDIVFILFITLIFSSSIWARNPVYAYNVGFQWLMFYGIYKLFQHFSYRKKNLPFLVWCLTIGLLISISIIVILFLTTADYSSNLTSMFHSDQFELIHKKYNVHKNSISSFLVLGTGIPLYWIIKSNTRRQIILSSAFLGYLAFVLMLSRCRGSLLAFVFILFLFYGYIFTKKTVNLKNAGVSLLLLVVAVFAAFILQANESDFLFFLNPLYGVQSAEGDGRLQIWDISFQLISERPWLGYGAGSWEFEYQKYGAGDLKTHSYYPYFYKHTHNYYIDTWFTVGIFGLICFVFLVLFYPLFSFLKKNGRNEISDIDYILFSGIFIFGIIALFYGAMYNNLIKHSSYTVLLFVFIGILNNKRSLALKKINMIMPVFTSLMAITILIKANDNNKRFSNYQQALKNKDYVTCEESLDLLENQKLGFIKRKLSIQELRTQLYLKQKKYNLAEKSIKKEIAEHPYNFNVWTKLGNISIQRKKYPQARYSFKQALLYNCDYIPASIGLLKTEKRLKKHQNIKAIKNELLYIDNFIQQFEMNKAIWSKHKKLNYMYKAYKKFKKQIDSI